MPTTPGESDSGQPNSMSARSVSCFVRPRPWRASGAQTTARARQSSVSDCDAKRTATSVWRRVTAWRPPKKRATRPRSGVRWPPPNAATVGDRGWRRAAEVVEFGFEHLAFESLLDHA